jgi:DNA replication protein DnaD
MPGGWIKIYRELIDKPIWVESTPEQKTILITLLCMANHEEKSWEFHGEKFMAKPGQMITSLPKIAEKCGKGVSIQNVRTALSRFGSYGFLTDQSTNQNRLITIVNWGLYQAKESESTDEATGNQQATNRQLTANKNVRTKEVKKKNKRRANKFDDTQMGLAKLLANLIKQNNPAANDPSNIESWANDIRLMMEQDNRTKEQIEYVIKWSQKDSFWCNNILSTRKLREKYVQLVGIITKQHERAERQNNASPAVPRRLEAEQQEINKFLEGEANDTS